MQWGQNAGHTGSAVVAGQRPEQIHAEFVYDGLADAMRRDRGGDLLVHYMAPLVDGDDVFTMSRGASTWESCRDGFVPCGTSRWPLMQWGVTKLSWDAAGVARDGSGLRTGARQLNTRWTTVSRWVPPPDDGRGWEPVFHPALTANFIYLPCEAGTIMKVDRASGTVLGILSPFAEKDLSRYVASPLTVDGAGAVYYTVVGLDAAGPWTRDIAEAWVVKIDAAGGARKVAFRDLVVGAPVQCTTSFRGDSLPWPPSVDAVAPTAACGGQRPGLNVAPAIAPDGTVYVVSRAHFNGAYGYLVALGGDLSLRWAASLRDRLNDGCDVLIPASGTVGGCRAGSRRGVDPSTNLAPAGVVEDLSTASPVVAPDGSVLYGTFTRYNYARGHLFRFSAGGAFLGAYDFGWDITPAVWAHDGTWSVIVKDNGYPVGSYCGSPAVCGQAEARYSLTSLSADLRPEWTYRNLNDQLCERLESGKFQCKAVPPGFEWCVNMVAVDQDGVVYANSEDGNLYAIDRTGRRVGQMFLKVALGAAYTPLAIGPDGMIYTQNDGTLYAVGDGVRRLGR